MKKYRYVIVSSQGTSLDVHRGPAKVPGFLEPMWYAKEEYQDLQELMERGWRPVRETCMGGGSAAGGAVVAFSLVLLEKDVAEEPPLVEPAQP
jgi:hypothetical protein